MEPGKQLCIYFLYMIRTLICSQLLNNDIVSVLYIERLFRKGDYFLWTIFLDGYLPCSLSGRVREQGARRLPGWQEWFSWSKFILRIFCKTEYLFGKFNFQIFRSSIEIKCLNKSLFKQFHYNSSLNPLGNEGDILTWNKNSRVYFIWFKLYTTL